MSLFCPLCRAHSQKLCHSCWLELNRRIPLPKAVVEPLTFRSLLLALFSKVRTGWAVVRSRSEAL